MFRVSLSSLYFQGFACNSNSLFCLIIEVKGFAAFLMKKSAQRRRTKVEIEAAKAHKELERKQFSELKEANMQILAKMNEMQQQLQRLQGSQ